MLTLTFGEGHPCENISRLCNIQCITAFIITSLHWNNVLNNVAPILTTRQTFRLWPWPSGKVITFLTSLCSLKTIIILIWGGSTPLKNCSMRVHSWWQPWPWNKPKVIQMYMPRKTLLNLILPQSMMTVQSLVPVECLFLDLSICKSRVKRPVTDACYIQ